MVNIFYEIGRAVIPLGAGVKWTINFHSSIHLSLLQKVLIFPSNLESFTLSNPPDKNF